MSTMQSEALKAAAAVSKRNDHVATLRHDMAPMKSMLGFVLAFQVAIVVKLFIH
jgi:hypothetical protein